MNDETVNAPAAKILTTKQIAEGSGVSINDALLALVTTASVAVATQGELTPEQLRTGKNAKHFAKVLGNAVVRALAAQGFELYPSAVGVTHGAQQACDRLAPPPPVTDEDGDAAFDDAEDGEDENG